MVDFKKKLSILEGTFQFGEEYLKLGRSFSFCNVVVDFEKELSILEGTFQFREELLIL